MHNTKSGCLYLLRALCLAVLSAHCLAFIQVKHANAYLFEKTAYLIELGLMTSPNAMTLPQLVDLKNIAYSSFFISLIVGPTILLGFIIVERILIELRKSSFSLSPRLKSVQFLGVMSKKKIILVALSFMAIAIISVVQGSVSFTHYLLFIGSVLLIHRVSSNLIHKEITLRLRLLLLVIFLLPVLPSISKVNKENIHSFRDIYLFESGLGQTTSAWYYRYTLFAAESIKPLTALSSKTFFIEAQRKSISTIVPLMELLKNDKGFVQVSDPSIADIRASLDDKNFIFSFQGQKKNIVVDKLLFNQKPEDYLFEILYSGDNNAMFREFLKYSFVVNLLLLCFGALWLLTVPVCIFFLRLLPTLKEKQNVTSLGSALVYVGVCLTIQTFMFNDLDEKVEGRQRLGVKLNHDDWQVRLQGLKVVVSENKEISNFQLRSGDSRFDQSEHIAERYWYAVALGQSTNHRFAEEELLKLLADDNPNVVYAAIAGLGRFELNEQSLGVLKNILQGSEHWYTQWYTHRTLAMQKRTNLNAEFPVGALTE